MHLAAAVPRLLGSISHRRRRRRREKSMSASRGPISHLCLAISSRIYAPLTQATLEKIHHYAKLKVPGIGKPGNLIEITDAEVRLRVP